MDKFIKKDIAVVAQNLIQFQSIKNGIDELISRGKSIDIYIPKVQDEVGYGNMFDDLYNNISKDYSIKRENNENIKYTILLEPYVTESYFKLSYEYRIKYKYSSISAKPNPVYKPELNLCYDGIICFGEYESNYISTYSKPLIIGNMKYQNFKKKKREGKPTLLYLPTFGEHSYIEEFIEEIENLKKDYEVIVKLHHGTSFLKTEEERAKRLRSKCDKCYDQSTELSQLLSQADVVLSDNSGSIFEAIYTNVPVAIFARNINDAKLEGFDTTQYLLVKKQIIPYTDNSKEILNIIKQAMSPEYYKKQTEWRDRAFTIRKDQVEEFVKSIEKFLNNDEDVIRYKRMHDILKKDYYNMKKQILKQEEDIKNMEEENRICREEYNIQKNQNEELKNLNDKIQIQEMELRNENDKLKSENSILNINLEDYSKVILEKTEENKKNNILIQVLKEKIQIQYDELEIYNNSKLYILVKKLYKVINFIRRRK